MFPCYYYEESCDTYFLSRVSCCNTLNYGCIHAAGILTYSS